MTSAPNPVEKTDIRTQFPDASAEVIQHIENLQTEVVTVRGAHENLILGYQLTERLLRDANTRIEEKDQEIAKLESVAILDPLTSLYNRSGAEITLAKMIMEARRNRELVAVYGMDADGLKRTNDTYGHSAGDDLLKMIGTSINQRMHKVDMAARLSGDEFAAACAVKKISGFDDAAHIGQRLCEGVAENCKAQGVTISCGFTLFDPAGLTNEQISGAVKSIFARADEAMYASKRSGRNSVHFAPYNSSDSAGLIRVWPKHGGVRHGPVRSLSRLAKSVYDLIILTSG